MPEGPLQEGQPENQPGIAIKVFLPREPEPLQEEFERLLDENGISYTPYLLKSATAPWIYQVLLTAGTSVVFRKILDHLSNLWTRHRNASQPPPQEEQDELKSALAEAATLFHPPNATGSIRMQMSDGRVLDLSVTSARELDTAFREAFEAAAQRSPAGNTPREH